MKLKEVIEKVDQEQALADSHLIISYDDKYTYTSFKAEAISTVGVMNIAKAAMRATFKHLRKEQIILLIQDILEELEND